MKNGEGKNMNHNILVTGGSGFVGKNLYKYLATYGDEYTVSLSNSSVCDLLDQKATTRFIRSMNPDCIVHLAATCGGIGVNKDNPGKFMRENLEIGLNTINAALEHGVKKFIMVGTVCSYPKFTPVPFKEEELWNGYPEETNAPYGIAKKTLMELIIAYNKQYGFNGVNLVPVNMYGPHDNFDLYTSHVIPAIILKTHKAILNNDSSIKLWGSGTPSREFLYVEDLCKAIELAIHKPNMPPNPINVGTGSEISISHLAYTICHMMGFDGVVKWDLTQPDGQPRRCLDIDKARIQLGYSPSVDLKTGLRRTIDWFLKNVNDIDLQ